MSKNYQHIFLDLDRTLWDFDKNSEETLHDLFQRYNLHTHLKVDFPEFLHKYEAINHQMWIDYRNGDTTKDKLRYERFLHTFQFFGYNEIELSKEFGEAYVAEGPHKKNVMPGTYEILDYLQGKGYHLHLISNGFVEAQTVKIKAIAIEKYLSTVTLSEEAGVQKPHAGVFELALKKANASKNESIYIGDDYEADVVGAFNFGIDQVFYNPNGFSHKQKTTHPTFEIEQLEQLKTIF